MKTVALSRLTFSAAVAALLAGCDGSQPLIGAPGAMPQTYQNQRKTSIPLRCFTSVMTEKPTT
jgi:hypothetical protein